MQRSSNIARRSNQKANRAISRNNRRIYFECGEQANQFESVADERERNIERIDGLGNHRHLETNPV